MKLKSNFILSLFLILSVLAFSPNSAEAKKPDTTKSEVAEICGGDPTSGGVVARPDTGDDCEFQPDEQKITFYRIELCTSEPTAPTLTAQVDRSSCSTFFNNDDGSEVLVIKNQGTQIGSAADYSALPHGTYTHGIITMGSVLKYKASVTFDGAMTDNGGNSGTTCVTKASSLGIIYGFSEGLDNFAKGNVNCQAGATAEEIEIGINTITVDGSDNCFHRLNITTSFGTVNAYLLESDFTTQSNVTTSDVAAFNSTGCDPQTANEIKYILGVMPFSNPLIINSRTAGLEVQYGNSRGMLVDTTNAANQFWKFDGGFFDFNLRAKQKRRSRGAWN
tara:strand:+ start:286 stop:1287 length:1002 start_codon:yes stop_codon:yes gene_type:complete